MQLSSILKRCFMQEKLLIVDGLETISVDYKENLI